MEKKRFIYMPAIIVLLIVCVSNIILGCSDFIGMCINFEAYVQGIVDTLFGENGIFEVLLSNEMFSNVEIDEIVELLTTTYLYASIFVDILSIGVAVFSLVLSLRLLKYRDLSYSELATKKKNVNTLFVFSIILICISTWIGSTILAIVSTVMIGKARAKVKMLANHETYPTNEYPYENKDEFSQELNNDTVVDQNEEDIVIDQTPVEEKREPSVDMENIYSSLALLERQYKNNEISESDYLARKEELLNKIK